MVKQRKKSNKKKRIGKGFKENGAKGIIPNTDVV